MFDWEKKNIPEWFWRGGRRKPYWISTRGLSIALLVLGYYLSVPTIVELLGLPPLSSRGLLLSTSIFTSALLTFALIAVYRDIGENEKLQTQTLENQEELLEIAKRPFIEVVGFDFDDAPSIVLSNFGEGVAVEISLVLHFQFNEDVNLEPGVCLQPISRVDYTDMPRQDRSIPSGREEISFDLKGCFAFREDDETESMPIPHGIAKMMREGLDGIQYQLNVRYFNLLGEMGLKKATPPKYLPLQNHVSTLREMEENSVPLTTWHEDIEFEELETSDMIHSDSNIAIEPGVI